MYLDKPFLITKETIKQVIALCDKREKHKKVDKKSVNTLTGATFDGWFLTISKIKVPKVRYAMKCITYKKFHTRRKDSNQATCIHTKCEMVTNGKEHDLYKILREQLMDNLHHKFRYGSLIICLVLYFLSDYLGSTNVHGGQIPPLQIK